MGKKLSALKKIYFRYLDRKARHLAWNLVKSKSVTPLLLDYIKELYETESSIKKLYGKGKNESMELRDFDLAYHQPISSDLEFLLSRLLFHYSGYKKLDWQIYLRRQVGKAAPDIRIDSNGKTIGILEIKAKAGWMQPFFSKERFEKDKIKFENNQSEYDPVKEINKTKNQLTKYYNTFNISPDKVFVFLPSLALVHRQKYTSKIDDYYSEFAKNSGLPKKNFILLSENLGLDLSKDSRKKYNCSSSFENFIKTLVTNTLK